MNDVEIILCDILKTTKFSLQHDESTLKDNEALLFAYVRYLSIDDENHGKTIIWEIVKH